MANFVYTNAARALIAGEIDLDEVGNDIRVALVMTNTTADTEKDKALMNAFTTLDEYGGANYVRKALAAQATAADNPNLRGEFDATDVTWTALGAGVRACQAALIYKHVTNDADSIPIALIDASFTGNGGDVTLQWNAEGIIQAQC